MFSKPLRQLIAADIERVCAEAVQEDENVEFKRTLAAKGGKDDPWIAGGNEIGEHARNDVVKEIVAFANAYGGTLILGVGETADKPARAAAIEPLPRCHDLAERLRLICRDMIDPQVPRLDAVGVETGDDGVGVVVVHAPRSRFAAHRHQGDRNCYQRHADRSEKMVSMREIQDLTLRVRQGTEEIEGRFLDARNEFSEEVRRVGNACEGQPVFGVCATLVPLDPVRVEHVHGVEKAKPTSTEIGAAWGTNGRITLHMPIYSGMWRPTLRGSANIESGDDTAVAVRKVSDDGLIEHYWVQSPAREDEAFVIYPSWVVALFANALLSAERFRLAAGAPVVEYGLEFVVAILRKRANVGGYGGTGLRPSGTIEPGEHVFPRYSIGPREDFAALACLFERNFWNLAGRDWGDEKFRVDFDEAFKRLGIE